MITFIPKHETIEVYNSRIIKKGLHLQRQAFFATNDFYIINPASMDFIMDRIYIK